jgi:hypothetical protein
MRSIQPSEARRKFFSLGTLAKEEVLFVTASTPFLIMPVEAVLGAGEPIPGVQYAPVHPFRLPATIDGPGGKSLSDLVVEGRR